MGKRDPKIPNSLGWCNPKTSQGSQNYWKNRSRGCNFVRKREKALTDPPVPLLWGRGEREKGKGINKRGNKGGKGEKRGKRENPGTHRARPSGALGGTGREEENKPGISSGIQPSLPQTAPCLWGKWGQRGKGNSGVKCQDLGQNGGIWSGTQPRAPTRLWIRSSAFVPAPVSLVLGIFNVNYYSKIIFLLFFFFNQAKEREQIPGNWLKHDTKGPG